MSEKDTSTMGHFSSIQTRELLAIGATRAETDETALYDVGDYERMELLLMEMCSGTGQSGRVLLEAVCDPETAVNVLIGIKDLAKKLAAGSRNTHEKAAATLLYHLTVAAALGYQEQAISSMAVEERLPLYRELVSELCDDTLVAVFEKAIATATSSRT